jgi:hypothetical protein
MALNFPMTQGKIPYDQMTMSLLRGILLMSLIDDVISGMHKALPFSKDGGTGAKVSENYLVSILPRPSGEDAGSSEPLKENCNCFCLQ